MLLQARVKELEAETSRHHDKLIEKQNELETVKLQNVTRSVSPSRAPPGPYPRSPSPPPVRVYGVHDTSLVAGERERSPTKYNRSFEELRAKLEGRPFTPPPGSTSEGILLLIFLALIAYHSPPSPVVVSRSL